MFNNSIKDVSVGSEKDPGMLTIEVFQPFTTGTLSKEKQKNIWGGHTLCSVKYVTKVHNAEP